MVDRGEKVIEINNLHFRYPDGTPALDEINLTVYAGESVAVVGHNGAGKSTLIKHLNGILQGHGEIKIGGLPLTKKNLRSIRSYVGVVFQDPDDQLFCPTVYDDLSFGLINMGCSADETKSRVCQTLTQVGLADFEKRSAHHLSYGQKKRVALATILCMLPKLLVLDEPTSNLDPLNEKAFVDLIKSLSETKIMVSHDLPILFQLCQRFLVMAEGRIIADLPREEFMANKALIKEQGLDYSFKCGFCQHYSPI